MFVIVILLDGDTRSVNTRSIDYIEPFGAKDSRIHLSNEEVFEVKGELEWLTRQFNAVERS